MSNNNVNNTVRPTNISDAAEDPIGYSVRSSVSLSIHLKSIVVDRLRSRRITADEFNRLFHAAMDTKRRRLEEVGDCDGLFNFPSRSQLIRLRNSLSQVITNDRLKLSYRNFKFLIEEMLSEDIPADDPLIAEAKIRYEMRANPYSWRLHPDGHKVGRLTFTHEVEPPGHLGERSRQRKYYLCRCDCGNDVIVRLDNVLRGSTKSCGCLNSEPNATHGMSRSATYCSWRSMLKRCTNAKHDSYSHYGGRGIKVCDRWLDSFENFYSDMGDRPDGTTIDRIDNDGNYEPSNCRWATYTEQGRNKRNNRLISGKPLTEWCEARHLNYNSVNSKFHRLLKSGMSDEQAVEKLLAIVR